MVALMASRFGWPGSSEKSSNFTQPLIESVSSPSTNAILLRSMRARASAGVFASPHQSRLWTTNSRSICTWGSTTSRSLWAVNSPLVALEIRASISLWTTSATMRRWPPSYARRIQAWWVLIWVSSSKAGQPRKPSSVSGPGVPVVQPVTASAPSFGRSGSVARAIGRRGLVC